MLLKAAMVNYPTLSPVNSIKMTFIDWNDKTSIIGYWQALFIMQKDELIQKKERTEQKNRMSNR